MAAGNTVGVLCVYSQTIFLLEQQEKPNTKAKTTTMQWELCRFIIISILTLIN